MLEDDEEVEPEVLVPEELVLEGVAELRAAAAAGAGVVVELVLPLSEEAGVFVLSVLAAAGFSEVSLPEPGFILSE